MPTVASHGSRTFRAVQPGSLSTQAVPAADAAAASAPAASTPPAESPRPSARSQRVLLRRIDPWSVFKISLVFYLTACLVLLIAGSLLWAGAAVAGVVENIERFIEDIGFADFKFSPARILQAATATGLTLVVGGTLGTTLLAVLYNLIADVSGGIRVTLTEDIEARGRSKRRSR